MTTGVSSALEDAGFVDVNTEIVKLILDEAANCTSTDSMSAIAQV